MRRHPHVGFFRIFELFFRDTLTSTTAARACAVPIVVYESIFLAHRELMQEGHCVPGRQQGDADEGRPDNLDEEPGYFDRDVHSLDRGITLQFRKAASFAEPAHFHPSIEINFVQNCDMTYSFSGQEVQIPRGRFCVFWAAYPHRKIWTSGEGTMTNVYVSLSEFLRWALPPGFVNTLLGGAVLTTRCEQDGDAALANRLASEVQRRDTIWQRLHAQEIQARLHRMSLEGWAVAFQPNVAREGALIGGHAIEHFEKMLSFVARNFASDINVAEVAAAAGLSHSHAMALFKNMLGRTITGHIKDMRIVHAKMLLVESDRKILTVAMECGFGSLSSFYHCFREHTGTSPMAFRRSLG